MMKVSPRFLPGLLSTPRWVRAVDWTANGVTWQPLKFHDGSITADATSQVRWGADLTVSGAPVSRHYLNAYGCLVRVRLGLAFSPLDVEWIPMGLYRVENIKQRYRSPKIEIRGSSLEASVIDDEFFVERVLPVRSGQKQIEALIRETIPGASISWRLGNDLTNASITTGTSRWDVIDGRKESASIARALGALVYTDRWGSFIVADVPTLQDEPVWTVDEGSGGVHIDSNVSFTRDEVYNVVVAMGQSEANDPIGPGVAEDDEETSPTYVGRSPLQGGFGRVVYHYSSPLLKDLDQCRKAARSILAPMLGARQQVDFSAVFNPALEPGDVVNVRNSTGLSRSIIDRLSFDLSGLKMEAVCRTTQGPVAGSVRVLDPTSQEA